MCVCCRSAPRVSPTWRIEVHCRSRRRLTGRAERVEKRDERVDLGGREVFAVGRHVPPALEHLANQLIARQPGRHAVEGRTALAALAAERMTRAALLVLHDE